MDSSNKASGPNRSILLDFDIDSLTRDKRLNKLLKSFITEVQHYAENQISRIKRLSQVPVICPMRMPAPCIPSTKRSRNFVSRSCKMIR